MLRKNNYGKSSSYSAIHKWLNWHYGNPLNCDKCGVKGKKNGQKWSIEFALKPNHFYRKDRSFFNALCMRCHRLQDLNEEMLKSMREGWTGRKKKYGLNKIDPKTGRFIKQCLPHKKKN